MLIHSIASPSAGMLQGERKPKTSIWTYKNKMHRHSVIWAQDPNRDAGAVNITCCAIVLPMRCHKRRHIKYHLFLHSKPVIFSSCSWTPCQALLHIFPLIQFNQIIKDVFITFSLELGNTGNCYQAFKRKPQLSLNCKQMKKFTVKLRNRSICFFSFSRSHSSCHGFLNAKVWGIYPVGYGGQWQWLKKLYIWIILVS